MFFPRAEGGNGGKGRGGGGGGVHIKSEFCGPRMFALCLQKQISFLKRYAKYIKYMTVHFGTTLVNGKPLPGRKPITTCKTGSGVVGLEASHANKRYGLPQDTRTKETLRHCH